MFTTDPFLLVRLIFSTEREERETVVFPEMMMREESICVTVDAVIDTSVSVNSPADILKREEVREDMMLKVIPVHISWLVSYDISKTETTDWVRGDNCLLQREVVLSGRMMMVLQSGMLV